MRLVVTADPRSSLRALGAFWSLPLERVGSFAALWPFGPLRSLVGSAALDGRQRAPLSGLSGLASVAGFARITGARASTWLGVRIDRRRASAARPAYHVIDVLVVGRERVPRAPGLRARH